MSLYLLVGEYDKERKKGQKKERSKEGKKKKEIKKFSLYQTLDR